MSVYRSRWIAIRIKFSAKDLIAPQYLLFDPSRLPQTMLHNALVTSEERGRERSIPSEKSHHPYNTGSTSIHDRKGSHSRSSRPTQYESDQYQEKSLRHMDSRSRSQLVECRAPKDPATDHPSVVQNPSQRHSLPHIFRKSHVLRNIPMGELVHRPQIKRWTSYDPFNQSSEKSNQESETTPSRLLSLNSRRSPRSRSRRSSYYHSSLCQTSNAFENLKQSRANGFDQDATVDPDASIYFEKQAISNVQANAKETPTLYSRVSDKLRIAHNSMASLVTARDSAKPSPLCMHTPIYQSELDSDDGSDSAKEDDVNDLMGHSPSLDLRYQGDSDDTDPAMIDSLALEISGFQDTFVNNSRQNHSNLKIGRTQQKLMDYKNLYDTDHMTFADQQNSSKGSAASTYHFRIQSELLTAQYTSIRLRFLEKSVALPRNPDKHRVKNTIGIYGFLDRYVDQKRPSSESSKAVVKTNASPSFEVGKYTHLLNRMWEPTLSL